MQQFKIGDWVRCLEDNDIIQLCESFASQLNENCQDCIIWQPKPNEPVWLYNDDETLEDLVLARFSNKVGNYYSGFTMNGQELSDYLYCQPFIGMLPTLNKG